MRFCFFFCPKSNRIVIGHTFLCNWWSICDESSDSNWAYSANQAKTVKNLYRFWFLFTKSTKSIFKTISEYVYSSFLSFHIIELSDSLVRSFVGVFFLLWLLLIFTEQYSSLHLSLVKSDYPCRTHIQKPIWKRCSKIIVYTTHTNEKLTHFRFYHTNT